MLNTVEEAIEDIKAGKVIIVVDDEDREAEGDFICAAQDASPEVVNFMALEGRGLICTALSRERIEELHIGMMAQNNHSPFETAFTVSVEARHDTTTGISAADRSITSTRLADPKFVAKDFISPGHTFPLKAQDGGVLVRAGHTEAAVDLAKLAGKEPAGVICEIMNPDGTMARMPQLLVLAKKLDMKIISVEDLIIYRSKTEKLVERIFEKQVKTAFGEFKLIAFRDSVSAREHLVFIKGELNANEPSLVRVQLDNALSDSFGIDGNSIERGIKPIAEKGGVFVYLRPGGSQQERWERSLSIQEPELDTFSVQNHNRNLGIGCQILSDLGIHKLKLISHFIPTQSALKGFGLEIVETVEPE